MGVKLRFFGAMRAFWLARAGGIFVYKVYKTAFNLLQALLRYVRCP